MKVSEMSNSANKDSRWKEECKCQPVKELTELSVEDPLKPTQARENNNFVKSYKIQYNTSEGR
jgi:hypothetical protein